jgi:hypothetical protein
MVGKPENARTVSKNNPAGITNLRGGKVGVKTIRLRFTAKPP